MKLPRFAAALLVASVLPYTSGLVTTAQAADRVKTLIDFGDSRRDTDPTGKVTVIRVFDHVWNDWSKGIADLRRKGTLIKSRTNKGNLGENGTAVKFSGTPAIQLDYVVGAGNGAKLISFKLVDADGTEATWMIPLEGKTAQMLVSHRMDLAKPDSIKGGKQPGLDLKHIDSWELQGDWSDDPTEVLLVKLVTAP